MRPAIQQQLPAKTAPLPELVPWDVSEPRLGAGGTVPSWPLCFRTAVMLDCEEGQVPSWPGCWVTTTAFCVKAPSLDGGCPLDSAYPGRARLCPNRGLLLGAPSLGGGHRPLWCLLAAQGTYFPDPRFPALLWALSPPAQPAGRMNTVGFWEGERGKWGLPAWTKKSLGKDHTEIRLVEPQRQGVD